MEKKVFRGLRFNEVEIIDFAFDCDSENENFLDYLAIFTSSYIVPTIESDCEQKNIKSLIKFISPGKLYIESNFNDDYIKDLFSIVYRIYKYDSKIIINDIFVNSDINKQRQFLYEIEKLQKKHKINVAVFVLLKYIEHRSCIKSNILDGGCDYGLKELLNVISTQDDSKYYNINVANFIEYNEDLIELKNVFQYILIVTRLLKKFLERNFDLLKQSEIDQQTFITKLKLFGDLLAPKDLPTSYKYAYNGFPRYNISAIAEDLSNYKLQTTEENGNMRQALIDIFFNEKMSTMIIQLEKAIAVLSKIKIKKSRNIYFSQKVFYNCKKLLFNAIRFLKPYINLVKLI